MTTGCEFDGDRLVEYAAGRLDPDVRARLDAHLTGCDACREELAVISALRAAPSEPPAGLEGRIRAAARAELRTAGAGARTATGPRTARASAGGRGSWIHRAPWALPLAAAAALAVVWVGVEAPWSGETGAETEVVLADEYTPYGTWPAADGVVAGAPDLTDLTVEELERLLEEMR